MAISTNSIIHYTKSLDTLLQILKNGFSLKYCKEVFYWKNKTLRYAYPMICFCDIPLSEVKKHLESYGHYGIGLKKDWAVEKGLNPVLYLERESFLSESIMQQIDRLHKDKIESLSNPEKKIDEVWRQELITLCSHIKNYDGDLVIDGKLISNYRFYDEREWRYIPSPSNLKGNKRAVLETEYVSDKSKYNNEVGKLKLEFNIAEDITYIIVKEDEDIHKALDFISLNFKKTLSAAELEILMTKIISTKQIIHDF
ncbi:MAG: abortive infection system antitoxin AbiGi family protein [Flavobacterium nitrogenifigens]|jgi:hypothetical protein|uniref:abortive infection system antitoxin AbiGi family protein n=1 Tax=Flavobacterium TaxID=237 RepID=UPI0028067630|nr:abortive infection system antitoxin AbiGi family protein [Flavobacterium nitrogenifigens]MDQ8011537.1 abortive infection system antitoxin AbiGi family protein [Flavobacterium nitrogenifigens]